MNIFRKLAGSTERYAFDFAHLLAEGETLSSIDGISIKESGATSSGLVISDSAISDETVTCLVAGGSSGHVYVLACEVTTSENQILVVEGAISV